MKNVFKIFMVLLMIGVVSCRDTKKEEEEAAAMEAALEKVETVESEAEEISKQINEEANELENSLKELDSI